MKRSFAILLATLATATVHAGSFGGPPPFTDGSPLISGVDGTYQASVRAKNVSGVFRFQYSGGSQTESTTKNNWVFFINGLVQRGNVVANITSSKVDGILDSLAASSGTNSNGTISLPIIMLNANNSSSGYFRGKMENNGNINGSGQLQPLPGSTNQVIGISQIASIIGADTPGAIVVTNASFTNIAGSIPITTFKFRGVRTSTVVTSTN